MGSRKIVLLFLAFHLVVCAAAQAIVRFSVIDAGTAKPLEDVAVTFSGLKRTLITDDGGSLSFLRIPPGDHEVRFSVTGYETKEISFVLSKTCSDTTILISLEAEEGTLQEVTVQSTRSNNRIGDEPQRVEILGQEEVNEELAIHPGNISKLLGENAGIQTQQTSAVSGNMTFRIIGLNGRYTQLLKDGFPLYGGLGNDLGLLSIPPLDLRQVEIIKGASSDLYGGNAIAGVIDLISKTPRKGPPSCTIMLNQTCRGGSDLNTYYSRRNEHFGITVMASASRQEPKDIDKDIFTDLPYLRQYNVAPKFFFYFDDSTRLEVGLNASWEDRKGGDLLALTHPDSLHSYIESNRSGRKYSTLFFEKRFHHGATFTLKNSAGYFTRDLSLPGYHFGGVEWNTFSEAAVLKTWAKNKAVAGLNVYTDRFTETPAFSTRDFNYDYLTMGAFVQDTWTPQRSWIIQAGVRADKHNRYGTYFLPRLSVLFKPVRTLSLRAGYGQGYNIPTLLNSISSQDELRYAYPVGTGVRPEIACSLNADMLYSAHISDEWNIAIDEAFYYTTIQHPIVAQPDSLATGKYYFINALLPIKAKVWESNIRIASDRLEFLIGYDHIDVKKKYDAAEPVVTLTPKDKIFLSGVYELEDNFRCGAEMDHMGSQYLDNGGQGKPYTLVGLMLQKTFGHFTLVSNAENILNIRQAQFGPLYKGTLQNPVFMDIYAPVDGMEINFVLKVSL